MSATWPNNAVVASTEATMPPLDVLLVWHTYLLVRRPVPPVLYYLSFCFQNPRTYHEYGIRSESQFSKNLRSPQSVEPVQAILGEGTFIEKMVNMGWTTRGRFDAPSVQATLVRCIAIYHGFLWLMATIPGHLLTPTLVSHYPHTHGVPL